MPPHSAPARPTTPSQISAPPRTSSNSVCVKITLPPVRVLILYPAKGKREEIFASGPKCWRIRSSVSLTFIRRQGRKSLHLPTTATQEGPLFFVRHVDQSGLCHRELEFRGQRRSLHDRRADHRFFFIGLAFFALRK